jgi:hypothetical protein
MAVEIIEGCLWSFHSLSCIMHPDYVHLPVAVLPGDIKCCAERGQCSSDIVVITEPLDEA